MDTKKQKVYRLTEAQFEKVIENTVKRAKEAKIITENKKDSKKVIKEEMGGEQVAGAIGIGVGAAGTITWACKRLFSSYKELKAKYPQASPSAIILNALSVVSKEIPR